jgi:colicin import membrane protein
VRNALILLAAVAAVILAFGAFNNGVVLDIDYVAGTATQVSLFWVSGVIAAIIFVAGLAASWFALSGAAVGRRKLEAELQSTYERLRQAEAREAEAQAAARAAEARAAEALPASAAEATVVAESGCATVVVEPEEATVVVEPAAAAVADDMETAVDAAAAEPASAETQPASDEAEPASAETQPEPGERTSVTLAGRAPADEAPAGGASAGHEACAGTDGPEATPKTS